MHKVALLISSLLLASTIAFAQLPLSELPSPIDYATARFARVVEAIRIDEKITLDGRLNETVWTKAQPAAHFITQEPNLGLPASGDTELFFLYDSDNLYVGVNCWDPNPEEIVVNELKEDFSPAETDSLSIMLDTLHDRQSGFIFSINAVGAKRDAQVSNDGAQQNQDWDGVWDVRTSRNDKGWTAELVIPFKTLRFSSDVEQEWGLQAERRLRHLNEGSFWSPLPRRYTVNSASMAGTLNGLHNVKPGRNLKVKPFVTGGLTEINSTSNSTTRKFDSDGGIDLKYGLTPQLTLDLTYRTDFSQVEVDQQQVNLTRFNLLFPEKREFFLENSGLFAFGGNPYNASLIPLFTRRIGLSAAGEPIPIAGGARVSGRLKSYDIGLISIKTEAATGVLSNNFIIGRLKKNYGPASWIGAFLTERDSTLRGDYNRVYGPDLNFRIFEKFEVTGYLFRSDTPGKYGKNFANMFGLGWRDDDWSLAWQHDSIDPNFNPELGFLLRKESRHEQYDVNWRPRPKSNRFIRNFSFSHGSDYYSNTATGKVESRIQYINPGITFQDQSSISLNVMHNFDRLVKEFAIRSNIKIPAGDYDHTRHTLNWNSNRSSKVTANANYSWGSFWSGTQESVGGAFGVRPNYHLDINLNYSRNTVALPTGDFTTDLVGARIQYAFTSNMYLNAFVQYNTDTKQISSNVRYQLIHHPLSDLFVVYNERRDVQNGTLPERTIILKLTNLFNF